MRELSFDSNRLKGIENRIKGARCLVVGDIMLDQYIYGEAKRISPEAPIPVVQVANKAVSAGGASNVAANIHHSSAKAVISGVIGNDLAGREISKILSDMDIPFVGIVSSDRTTTSKTRIVGKGQQVVRFDEEIVTPVSDKEADELIRRATEVCGEIDLVVISDYAKGVCTDYVCKRLIDEANRHNRKVVVDPKGNHWEKYSGAFIVTPNWSEFLDIAGDVSPDDESAIRKSALAIMEEYGFSNLLVTRSERGMTLVTRDAYISYRAEAREVADVSGAGDTAIATLSVMLAANVELGEAVYWANRAAGLAVERQGTSVVGIEDLIEEGRWENSSGSCTREFTEKIMTIENLLSVRKRLKNENKRLVFTNGCFDLVHVGHLQYLSEARKLGDFLVVGLNSDSSVKRQSKGESRPVNSEQDRARMLAAMEFVDAVVIFDEDTPYEILREIKPELLVKGGDYKGKDVIGREFARETRILSFAPGYSTTGLINRIRGERSIS